METGIQIGVSKETVAELGKVIVSILESKQDQVTQQKALETLQGGLRVENSSISNCIFGDKKE